MPKFWIKGVDRESGFDTEFSLWADDQNNAKIKADLEGVTVTSVTMADLQVEEVLNVDAQPLAQHGVGCPACGSRRIEQKSRITALGWGLICAGILGAFCTRGIAIILCVIGPFVRERLCRCLQCGWLWRA